MSDFPDFGSDFFKLLEELQGTRVGAEWARYRQGSQPDVWSRPGSGTRTTLGGFVQVGSFKWTGGAAVSGGESITFPVSFADEPLLFCNVVKTTPLGIQVVCQVWSDGPGIDLLWWAASNVTEIWFHWLAYGPGDI